MATPEQSYAARLDIDYPEKLDRFTSFFRLIWIIPIAIVLSLVSAASSWTVVTETGETITRSSGGIASGLFFATVLMIVFRERYPRWWFDFAREFVRFAARVAAYLFLLTDRYPVDGRRAIGASRGRLPRRRAGPQSLAAVGEMAARDSTLHRALRAVAHCDRRRRHCLVRHPLHGTVPKGTLRLRRGGLQMGTSSRGVRPLLVTDRYPPFSLK